MRFFYFNFKKSIRNIIYSNKIKAFIILLLLTVAFVITAIYARSNESDLPQKIVSAISYINTTEKIYTVTVNLHGNEDRESLDLFIDVCRGFNITPLYFIKNTWFIKNSGSIDLIKSSGNLALYCDELSKLNRNEVMKYVAEQNDNFYKHTETYPKYVRESNNDNPFLGEILNAYRQYYISANLEAGTEKSIKPGDILVVELSSRDSVYSFIKMVSQALAENITAVEMKDFIKEYEKTN
ncbi:hypothetical protein LJB90_00430 [Eubacteriales bacterium OttesenSCG-928-G02]|nr:hypothetical protein [Eubacteriales bacterium OttesenSCG-928-G02]